MEPISGALTESMDIGTEEFNKFQEIIKKIRKNKIKVYIASPYTLGDVAVNVKTQLDVADKLMDNKFIPFVPLLAHFQHMVHPRPYQDWLNLDLEWISSCDYLLRLPGESKGADEEVKKAKELGKKVFFVTDSVIDTIEYMKNFYL